MIVQNAMRAPTSWPWLVPFLIAALAYAPSLGYGYVWDDNIFIAERQSLRDWTTAWLSAWQLYDLGSAYYFRPLGVLSLAFDHLVGTGVKTAHLMAVLIHAANSALVAGLALHLHRSLETIHPSSTVACLAGTLYALHPALIQSVAWLSCRFDLLLTLFGLSMLMADGVMARGWRHSAALGLLFFLAALSKESAVVLPALLLVWRMVRQQPAVTAARPLLARSETFSILAAGTAYLALRMQAIGGLHAMPLPALPLPDHLAVVLKSLGTYLWLTIAPFTQLNPFHRLPESLTWHDAQIWTGACSLTLLAFASWRKFSRTACMLVLCYLTALLPVSNLLRLHMAESFVHERFLTLPLAFACMLAATLAGKAWQSARAQTMLRVALSSMFAVWMILSLATLYTVMPHWRNNLQLWTWAVQSNPQLELAQSNYLTSLNQAGKSEGAIRYAQSLLKQQDGKLAMPHRLAYARALSDSEQQLQALDQIWLAISTSPSAIPSQQLARLCAEAGWMQLALGRQAAAVRMLSYSIQLNPEPTEPHYNLGIALAADGHEDEARIVLQQALVRMPPLVATDHATRIPQWVAAVKELSRQGTPRPDSPAEINLTRTCDRKP